MQGIGSFLLHLTQRFAFFPPSDLHPFRRRRPTLPIRRFTFVFFIHKLCPHHPHLPLSRLSLPRNHLSLVSLSSFPCYFSRLIHFLLIFFCLFRPPCISVFFNHIIILVLLFSCPSFSLLFVPFFLSLSLSLPLVYSNFLR